MSILQDLLALQSAPTIVAEESSMSASEASDVAGELQELHDTMTEAMEQVRGLVRRLPREYRGQAEAYWIPHIMIALGGEHEWMSNRSDATMKKLIDELKSDSSEHDEEPNE